MSRELKLDIIEYTRAYLGVALLVGFYIVSDKLGWGITF
jgi:hypothetical protein